MSDFWQGEIPTFQRLNATSGEFLEKQLAKEHGARSVTLLMPCLASDIGSVAFEEMLVVLKEMLWLERIVFGLDQASESEFHTMAKKVTCLPQKKNVLWLDDPEVARKMLADVDRIPASGKGRNVWLSLGWILQQPGTDLVAMHDCDIRPYRKEMLARLVYPVARPEFGYRFSKGYYARFSDQLHGRITRLLFCPLLAVLAKADPANVLRTLKEFRYPLAGEVCFEANLAREFSFPAGWGMETSILAGIIQTVPINQTCQVDLCERYDHRHHPLENLSHAAGEVIEHLLQLCEPNRLDASILSQYEQAAAEASQRHAVLAEMNGLSHHQQEEIRTIARFTELLRAALSAPCKTTFLPPLRNIFTANSVSSTPCPTPPAA